MIRKGHLPKHLLASILQHLTTNELNIMSSISGYILETILQYHLVNRRLNQGRLYTFGNCRHGKLGDGRTDNHHVGIPTLVRLDKKVIQVDCGSFHTGVVTEDGLLYTYGNGEYGKLGDGNTDSHVVGIPTLVPLDKKIIQISCGSSHTGVVTEDGQLYMFGDGSYGKLGDGRTDDHDVGIPTLVRLDKKVIQVSCGAYHTGVVTEDGLLYMVGDGRYGKLGDGNVNGHDVGIPSLVRLDKIVIQVSCGWIHTGVVTEDGLLYMFGSGTFGILGNGRTDNHEVGIPTLVRLDKKVIQVDCGEIRTGVVTNDDVTSYCGYNPSGTEKRNISITIPGKDIVQISHGYEHTVMVVKELDNPKWLIIE